MLFTGACAPLRSVLLLLKRHVRLWSELIYKLIAQFFRNTLSYSELMRQHYLLVLRDRVGGAPLILRPLAALLHSCQNVQNCPFLALKSQKKGPFLGLTNGGCSVTPAPFKYAYARYVFPDPNNTFNFVQTKFLHLKASNFMWLSICYSIAAYHFLSTSDIASFKGA